jgi:uracil-DNA glycosylase family 4
MDRAAEDDLAGELLTLTRQLRGQLLRHATLGAWAAPGGASARVAPPEPGPAEPEEVLEAGQSPIAAPLDAPDAPDAPLRAPMAIHDAPLAAIPAAVGDVPGPRGGLEPAPVVTAGALIAPSRLGRRTLPEIRAELGDCTRCKLHSTRTSIVFGVGAADTPLMFVGEAPGEQEDKRGEPFVGPAGQLLDKMIEAMGWTRATVYIANTTKCRPPGNRNPQPDELAQCMPFLHAQIAAIAPRIIVALGRPAANQLLGTDAPISALRGKFHDYARATTDRVSLKIMPTFHPAYLLRDPSKKRTAWEDLKLVMAELARLDIAAPNPPRG